MSYDSVAKAGMTMAAPAGIMAHAAYRWRTDRLAAVAGPGIESRLCSPRTPTAWRYSTPEYSERELGGR